MNSVKSKQVIHQGRLVISHHLESANQVSMGETSDHLVCYLLNGQHNRKVTQVGDQEYIGTVRSGDMCIKPASHSGFWSWESLDDSILFFINPDFLQQIALENEFLNPDKVELKPILNHQDAQLNNLVSLFHQEIDTVQPGSIMYLESLSNMLGVHLLRNYCAFPVKEVVYSEGLPTYKLKQVVDYINAHLADNISLQDIASHVKMSQSHFSTLFRKSTGKSPHKFVIQQRVDYAEQLLKTTDLSITEVAISSGFCDQSHLSRHMQRNRGFSPKKIRESCRKTQVALPSGSAIKLL